MFHISTDLEMVLQMIKKENESLRRSLDKRTRQLDRMHAEHRDCDAKVGGVKRRLSQEAKNGFSVEK